MSFYPYRFIYRGIYGGIFGRRLKTACRSGMCDTCRAPVQGRPSWAAFPLCSKAFGVLCVSGRVDASHGVPYFWGAFGVVGRPPIIPVAGPFSDPVSVFEAGFSLLEDYGRRESLRLTAGRMVCNEVRAPLWWPSEAVIITGFKNGCSNGLRTAPKRQIRPVKRTGGDDGR